MKYKITITQEQYELLILILKKQIVGDADIDNIRFLVKLLDTLENKNDYQKDDKQNKIDHSIDVRYEPDAIKAFNKFIRKWCGEWYPHLIDSDENDGQFMREKIEELSVNGK